MIIDIKKLKFSGKTESNFDFLYEPEENLLSIPNAYFKGPGKITGVVELHNGDVYADGRIECLIVGECARCLEEAEYVFDVDFSERFVESDPDEFDYLYKLGKVDLTKMVNDNILSNLPTVILCKEDCKGLCPVCGCNLNNNKCECNKREVISDGSSKE